MGIRLTSADTGRSVTRFNIEVMDDMIIIVGKKNEAYGQEMMRKRKAKLRDLIDDIEGMMSKLAKTDVSMFEEQIIKVDALRELNSMKKEIKKELGL